MDKKGISKKVVIWIVIVSVLLLAGLAVLFVVFFRDREDSIKEKDSGAVLMTYRTEENSLSISSPTPIKDEDGIKLDKKSEYFDFTVNTRLEDSSSIEYEVAITPSISDKTALESVKVYLERQNNGTYTKLFEPKVFAPSSVESSLGAPVGSMVLAKVVKDKDGVDNYRLRVWIDEKATISEDVVKKISFDVDVYGKANS